MVRAITHTYVTVYGSTTNCMLSHFLPLAVGVSTSPLSVEFTVSCPYHWLLSWGSPAVTNGDITHFEVEWMDVSSYNSNLLQVPVSGPSAMYEAELKDLSPETEYDVRVRAHNRNGVGIFSDCLLINSGMCGRSKLHGTHTHMYTHCYIHLYTLTLMYCTQSYTF